MTPAPRAEHPQPRRTLHVGERGQRHRGCASPSDTGHGAGPGGTPLLLLLLLLLVPPEVRLDGDGRLLGRVAEELALAAGVGGAAAWEDKQA